MIICTFCGAWSTQTKKVVGGMFHYSPATGFWEHIGCKDHAERRAPCLDITEPPFKNGERIRYVFTNREGVVRYSANDADDPGRVVYVVGWLDGGSALASSELWLLRPYDPDPLFVCDDGKLYAPDADAVLWSIPIPDALRGTITPGKHYADRWGVLRHLLTNAVNGEGVRAKAFDAAASTVDGMTICSFCDRIVEGDDHFSIKRRVGGKLKRAAACSTLCAKNLIDGGFFDDPEPGAK